jgi:integrase
MATINERTNKAGQKRYTVQIRLKGARPVTKTFQTKGEANAYIQDMESDIRHGRHLPAQEAERRTLAELIARYLESPDFNDKAPNTRYCQKAQLEYWRRELGHKTLSALTTPVIADERDRLLQGTTQRKTGGKLRPEVRYAGKQATEGVESAQRSPATCNRYLAALSHCLTYGQMQLNWIAVNPCRAVKKSKEPKGRVRVLTDEERGVLLAAGKSSKNKTLYPFLILALSTGCRKNEILHLRWPDIDFTRRTITIQESKNGTRRVLPLRGTAETLLEERSRLRRMDTDLVFPGPQRHGRETQPAAIRNAWDRALTAAGIEDFRVHDLRHCAASAMAMNGASLPELAALLGHRQLSMVQRYAHFCEGHGGDLIERMNAAMFDLKGAEGAEEA